MNPIILYYAQCHFNKYPSQANIYSIKRYTGNYANFTKKF